MFNVPNSASLLCRGGGGGGRRSHQTVCCCSLFCWSSVHGRQPSRLLQLLGWPTAGWHGLRVRLCGWALTCAAARAGGPKAPGPCRARWPLPAAAAAPPSAAPGAAAAGAAAHQEAGLGG